MTAYTLDPLDLAALLCSRVCHDVISPVGAIANGRLAFGAAGSAGASIDTGDAEGVARGLIADEKTKLVWNATRALLPKNKVKLILNLVLIASQTIPRGGVVEVTIDGTDAAMTMTVT